LLEPIEVAMKERRAVSRKRSFLQGRIYFNNRRTSVDCLIREVSEHGARLKFASTTVTPDVMELHIPAREESYRAKVIWRNADEIGVTFNGDERSPSLAPDTPSADWSSRIHKLERDMASLARKFNELQTALRQMQGAD
jgi:hypothetical protein